VPELEQVLEQIAGDVRAVAVEGRDGSRYVASGASKSVVDRVANGGSVERELRPLSHRGGELEGAELLRAIKAARLGDGSYAHKGWNEGTGSAGGFLVKPSRLVGYIEARRAASPLRERFSQHSVDSHTVEVVLEGNGLTAAHVPELGAKPSSTGSVAQKNASIFTVAGLTVISNQLLADSGGLAVDLIVRQFNAAIALEIERALISGTGTGEPTGLRNAAGVNAQAVDGQTGQLLRNSVVKAMSRIRQDFFEPDTVVFHPRDVVKIDLAVDGQGQYLFPNGVRDLFAPAQVVVDANVPANLGGASNESIIIVMDAKAAGAFFSRSELEIDANPYIHWGTNETSYRGEERYGFAVLQPSAVEILSGILP
jgi:HK97 family phage major capsid protein